MEVNEGIELGIGFGNHIATTATIAPLGWTLGFIWLPTEAGHTVAALSTTHVDEDVINKHVPSIGLAMAQD